MNIKDQIRAEIERRHTYQKEMYNKKKPDGRPNDGWAESIAIMGELEELRFFLDTIPEQPAEGLLEEVDRFWANEFKYHVNSLPTISVVQRIARHFAEWGAEHLKR
jgi:hypothetical protein